MFKYAKILTQPPQSTSTQKGSSLSRIEIEVGYFQKRELLSSQIYAFGSNADSGNVESTNLNPSQSVVLPLNNNSTPAKDKVIISARYLIKILLFLYNIHILIIYVIFLSYIFSYLILIDYNRVYLWMTMRMPCRN